MPMPASTFTLAVGHWHRVTAETFPALETEVGEKPDCGNMAKPRPERGKPTESRLVSRPGKSSRKTVKDSPLQTGRYVLKFPVLFFSEDRPLPTLKFGPSIFREEIFLSLLRFKFGWWMRFSAQLAFYNKLAWSFYNRPVDLLAGKKIFLESESKANINFYRSTGNTVMSGSLERASSLWVGQGWAGVSLFTSQVWCAGLPGLSSNPTPPLYVFHPAAALP